MQAANVKQFKKLDVANTVINQTSKHNTQNVSVSNDKATNVVKLTKSQSFSRFLEANSDCV